MRSIVVKSIGIQLITFLLSLTSTSAQCTILPTTDQWAERTPNGVWRADIINPENDLFDVILLLTWKQPDGETVYRSYSIPFPVTNGTSTLFSTQVQWGSQQGFPEQIVSGMTLCFDLIQANSNRLLASRCITPAFSPAPAPPNATAPPPAQAPQGQTTAPDQQPALAFSGTLQMTAATIRDSIRGFGSDFVRTTFQPTVQVFGIPVSLQMSWQTDGSGKAPDITQFQAQVNVEQMVQGIAARYLEKARKQADSLAAGLPLPDTSALQQVRSWQTAIDQQAATGKAALDSLKQQMQQQLDLKKHLERQMGSTYQEFMTTKAKAYFGEMRDSLALLHAADSLCALHPDECHRIRQAAQVRTWQEQARQQVDDIDARYQKMQQKVARIEKLKQQANRDSLMAAVRGGKLSSSLMSPLQRKLASMHHLKIGQVFPQGVPLLVDHTLLTGIDLGLSGTGKGYFELKAGYATPVAPTLTAPDSVSPPQPPVGVALVRTGVGAPERDHFHVIGMAFSHFSTADSGNLLHRIRFTTPLTTVAGLSLSKQVAGGALVFSASAHVQASGSHTGAFAWSASVATTPQAGGPSGMLQVIQVSEGYILPTTPFLNAGRTRYTARLRQPVGPKKRGFAGVQARGEMAAAGQAQQYHLLGLEAGGSLAPGVQGTLLASYGVQLQEATGKTTPMLQFQGNGQGQWGKNSLKGQHMLTHISTARMAGGDSSAVVWNHQTASNNTLLYALTSKNSLSLQANLQSGISGGTLQRIGMEATGGIMLGQTARISTGLQWWPVNTSGTPGVGFVFNAGLTWKQFAVQGYALARSGAQTSGWDQGSMLRADLMYRL